MTIFAAGHPARACNNHKKVQSVTIVWWWNSQYCCYKYRIPFNTDNNCHCRNI